MKCGHLLLAVMASVGSAVAVLRQEYQMNSMRLAAMKIEDPSFPAQYYTKQKLDHFNPNDGRTFSQRYFTNFHHFKLGGPIFLTIGGEGQIGSSEVSGRVANELFAMRLHGAVVALEHRFYGKSQPFNSLATEHLQYLNSRQALHDLAQFQQWFTAKHSLSGSNVFCMGGSYPGNLAAWYRMEFPNLTAGCWSASAPLHAVEDWPGYGQMVWDAMATNEFGVRDDAVATKLYAGYERLSALIHDSTPEALVILKKKLNICPGTLVSQQDRENLESTISTALGTVMQYNNTQVPHIKEFRSLAIAAESPLEAALSVSRALNLTIGQGPGNCTDYSISALHKLVADSQLSEKGEGSSMRAWTWQTCNEFGYFQTGTAAFERPTMYTRGSSSRALYQQICSDVFGINDAKIGARIENTNEYYGGKSPRGISKVFFSHGGLDAWSLLGITSYPKNDQGIHVLVAPLGSHCVGLYAPSKGELPDAIRIREHAFELIRKWDADTMHASRELLLFS